MDDLLRLLKDTLALDDQIDANTPLLSSGLIDSFAVVGLLIELESHYGVVIDPEDIDAATFDTPGQILERLSHDPS